MEGSETPKDGPEKTKRDPDKLKETLNRMRSKKSMLQIDKPAEGGGATETVGLMATSSALEEKRKQLKLLKQQSKLMEDNSEDNKRPRSPSRGASRRGKSSRFPSDLDEDDDEDEEEDEEAENDKEEQVAEEPEDPVYQDIVRVEAPVQSFPLTFLPNWRHTENLQHPGVLLVPMPNPDLGNVVRPANVCMKSTSNAFCTCFGCNEQFRQGSEPLWRSGKQFRERDFLAQNQGRSVRSGMSDLDRQHWVAQQEVAAPELRALHKLIKKSFADHDDNDENNVRDGEEEELEEQGDETSGLLDRDNSNNNNTGEGGAAVGKTHAVEDDLEDIFRKPYHENGMYLSNSSTLSQMLLYGEDTAPHLASMTPADLRLSRVTQRTLRELRNSLEEEKVRQHWQQMKRDSEGVKGTAAVDRGLGPISEEGEAPGEVYSATHPTAPALPPSIPSQVKLLKQLATAPMLRLSENPLDTSYCQPVIPEPSEEYGGGELGQWGPEATLNERFGPLPHGWKDHGAALRKGGPGGANTRAILRVHLHQLILSDHPLMSPEERRLVDLKISYSQYRALFKQKTLEYLMLRLLDLIEQLTKVFGFAALKAENEEEEVLLMRRLYNDLIETLPALNELNQAMDGLTLSIYEGWREIVEIRRQSGVCNTAAHLTVRRIRSNLQTEGKSTVHRRLAEHDNNEAAGGTTTPPNDFGLNEDEATAIEGEKIWNKLRHKLTNVPHLLQSVQRMLFKSVLEPSPHPDDEPSNKLLSPRSGANKAAERQSKLDQETKKLTKVVTVVTEARDQLLGSSGLVPPFALRLTEDGTITPDNQLSAGEIKRRATLNQCKYKVVVRINNKIITSTEYYKLRISALSVDFKKHFEFRVLHQPYDVTLDLYQSRVGLLDPLETLLASVSIPIPGINSSSSGGAGGGGARGAAGGGRGAGKKGAASSGRHSKQTVTHSYAPILDWYSFASFAKPSPVSSEGSTGSYLGWFGSAAAPPAEGEHALATALAGRRTEGALLVTSEYDVSAVEHHNSGATSGVGAVNYEGVRSDEIALIPQPKASGESILTRGAAGSVGVAAGGHAAESSSVMSRVHDFTRENDFQQLLPDFNELDLNDPSNDHLLYLKSKRSSAGEDDVFRLSGFDYSVPFTTAEGVSYSNYARLKECNRMKLLRIRTVKPYLFSDPIPLSETLIKSSEAYKRIFSAEMEANAAALDPSQDPRYAVAQLAGGKESVNVAKVAGFLERVRSSQTAMNRRKRKKKVSTSSVVIETDYLVLEELDIDLLVERRRSLKPKVKARAPVTIAIDSCDLLVQVVGARNIPLRSEFDYSSDVAAANKRLSKPKRDRGGGRGGGGLGGAGSESEGDGPSDGDNLLRRSRSSMNNDTPIVSDHMLDERKMKEKRRAKTFVEVKFQDKVVSTTAYDGGTPMWKQSVSLPFKPAGEDFSPNSLDQCREDVHFTLFDEVCEDDAGKGGFLEGESTVRVEKRYLGSFSVPFNTLYHEGRIDGVFRMDTPVMNIGYDHSSSYATRRQVDNGSMFVTDEDDALPSARGGAGHNPGEGIQITGPFSAMYFLFDCFLKATTMPVTIVGKKSLSDSLYYSGSYIHQETQAEFSYFASSDKSTYIKLMLTFDPILVTNPVIEDDITTSTVIRDDRYLVLYNREWQASIHAIGPHTKDRTYKLFGTNSNGLNVLICRYLTPLKPPSGFMSRRGVLHLVSMIPFMKDSHSFIGEADLWCTCSQFWEIGAGDEEEHAVMLYNYLYYLSIASGDNKSMLPPAVKGKKKPPPGYPTDEAVRNECLYLVLGRAIPEGDTVYILMRDKRRKGNGYGPESFLVVNPCNGFVYSAIDPNCPLRNIYCIATPYNIWGNIQVESSPSEIRYDVFASDQWRPLFGHRMKPPPGALNSIQDDITYFDSSAGYALEVEKSIHTQLRNSMRRWRSKRHRSTTTFHPDACNVMHELLPSLEQWKRSGGTDGDPTSPQMDRSTASPSAGSSGKMDYAGALEKLQSDARERMRTLLRTRTLKGCPINVPFTDVDEIINKIKTLCVHEAQHPEVQFVLAVRAFPIFNNILSVWIFVGTLETIG